MDLSQIARRLGCKFWFAAALFAMVSLNLTRLACTWKAFGTDGMEQVGFPFGFFERGGYSYHANLYADRLILDVAIAIVVAYVCGRARYDALRRDVP